MQSVSFYKLSPGGNSTILILNDVSDPLQRAAIANELMNPLHLGAEQVGFVSFSGTVPRLEMMGGEFCGNAARCLAALLAYEKHPSLSGVDMHEGAIEVSGVSTRLAVRVYSNNGEFSAAVEMPVHTGKKICHSIRPGVHLVYMEGISHILLDASLHPMPKDYCGAASLLRQELELDGAGAVGCIWYKEEAGRYSIEPVVWVKQTDTTLYETGCGSGSVALGISLALAENTSVNTAVLQPSGQEIHVNVRVEGKDITEAWIGGPVRLIARGETCLYSSI